MYVLTYTMRLASVLLGLLVATTDAPSANAGGPRPPPGPPLSTHINRLVQSEQTVYETYFRLELSLGVVSPSLPRANLSAWSPSPPGGPPPPPPPTTNMEDMVYEDVYKEAWTTCLDSLWNTCVGRCGMALTGAPYVCGCDSACRLYGDCCLDYDLECTFDLLNDTESDIINNMGDLQCVSVSRDSKYGVLMISTCAVWWPPINISVYTITIEANCLDPSETSLHPVSGGAGFIYKNNFCAECNGVFDAKEWSGSTHCGGGRRSGLEEKEVDTSEGNSWLDNCEVRLNLSEQTLNSYRTCTYDVSECTPGTVAPQPSGDQQGALDSIGARVNGAAVHLCSAYSKPVFRIKVDGSAAPMYKNVHCAHCNNVPTGQLYCPAWRYIPTNTAPNEVSPYLFFETGQSVDEQNHIKEIPASFAILFNFGHQSNVPVPIFSSQQISWFKSRQDNCNDNELWDPFSEMCRKIYCSSEFSFLDFHCIDIYDNVTSADDGVVIPDNVTEALLMVDVSSVLITLAIQLDLCLSDEVDQILDEQFVDIFAESLNVSSSRFVNFTIGNITTFLDDNSTSCPRELQVSVILLGPDPNAVGPQPSIEMVSASVAYSVSLNHLFLYFEDGVTARVFGLQEQLVKLVNNSNNNTEQWCSDGQQVMYQNGDFTPIMHFYTSSNYSVDIYINSTGRTYPPGQFIGNIMFQGEQRSTLANVTGAVVVCDLDPHNGTCMGVLLNQTEYMPLQNGSIMYVGANTYIDKIYNPGQYDILPSGNALICMRITPTIPENINWNNGLDPSIVFDMKVQSLMSTLLLSYSSLAMVITIITYLAFAELRNVPGKNLLNLTFCSLVYQLTFLTGMRESVTEKPIVCMCVAIGLHYSILASFFWMNVIAFNLYRTFAAEHRLMTSNGARARSATLRYALYAYGCPLLIVGCCVVLDLDPTSNVNIGYGTDGACWISSPLALLLSFAAVIALVLLANLLFYVLTVRSIRRISRKTKLTTGQCSRQSELAVYVRMSTSMGFTWLFGFLSGIPDLPYLAYDVFSYLFVILNTLQGIFIFFAFVCTAKVMALYKGSAPVRYLNSRWRQLRPCKECRRFVCRCQKPIIRTISNETCKSALSVDDDDPSDGREGQRRSGQEQLVDIFSQEIGIIEETDCPVDQSDDKPEGDIQIEDLKVFIEGGHSDHQMEKEDDIDIDKHIINAENDLNAVEGVDKMMDNEDKFIDNGVEVQSQRIDNAGQDKDIDKGVKMADDSISPFD